MTSPRKLPIIPAPEEHRLEFFGDDCPLCRRYLQEIEVGKCFRVDLSVYDAGDAGRVAARSSYGITAAPTVILDGRVKIEGRPEPWFNDEYAHYDDCRAALGALLKEAPPLPAALRVGKTHPLP